MRGFELTILRYVFFFAWVGAAWRGLGSGVGWHLVLAWGGNRYMGLMGGLVVLLTYPFAILCVCEPSALGASKGRLARQMPLQ